MDWNWLFSSVAQSVAALVGVMGAFLISRVLASESNFLRNRTRTHELHIQTQRLVDRAIARNVEQFALRELKDDLDDVARAVRNETPGTPEEYYERFNFTPMFPKDRILEEIARKVASEVAEKGRGSSYSLIGSLGLSPEFTVAARQNLRSDREAVAQLAVDVKDHIRQVQQHLETISGQSDRSPVTRATLVALLLMFYGGVLLPLSFLPVPSNGDVARVSPGLASAKWWSLAVASVLFTALMVGLGALNERFTHGEDDIRQLREALEPGHYSRCFKVQIDNGVPL